MTRRIKLFIAATVLLTGILAAWWLDRQPSFEDMGGGPGPEMARLLAQATNQAALPPLQPGQRIRLALGPLGLAGSQDGAVNDLLTAQLSKVDRFELVERRELERVLREVELGAGGLVRAADAVKVGRLARADWFLLGSLGRTSTTNAILARLVDARSSVVREVAILPWRGTGTAAAEDLASFLQHAAAVVSGANGSQRGYLALGSFEDLGVNNRYAELPQRLRTHLTTSLAGSGCTLVERELVNTLLNELRLDMAGLTVRGATNPPAPVQTALWLVDGYYQSYEQSGPEVDLILRVERVYCGADRASVRGQPGEAFLQQVVQTFARLQTNLVQRPFRVSWSGEAGVQYQRGLELSRIQAGFMEFTVATPSFNLGSLPLGGYRTGDNPEKQAQNLTAAVQAFETVMLLDPGFREAKLYLATCLRHPVIDRVEEGRNLLRELIAEKKDDRWDTMAKKALGASYLWEDDRRAAELYNTFAGSTTNTGLAEWFREAARDASTRAIQPEDPRSRSAAEEALLADIQSVWDQAQHDKYINGLSLGRLYADPGGRKEYAQAVARFLPVLTNRFPTLRHHLTSLAVSTQTTTNSPVIQAFRQSLEEAMEHPDRIFCPRDYFGMLPLHWVFEHRLYDLAARTGEAGRIAAERGVGRPLPDNDLVLLGFAYLKLERWQDGLALFDTFNGRTVVMWGDSPWARQGQAFPTDRATRWCREKLGLREPRDDRRFLLPDSCHTNKTDFVFDVDQQAVWMGSGSQLVKLDLEGRELKRIQLVPSGKIEIEAVCVGPEAVFIGTTKDGLIRYDKTSGTLRGYQPEDGLLLKGVTSLCRQGDTLWLGYGVGESGGFGRLGLETERFSSLATKLPTNLILEKAAGPENHLNDTNAAPRSPVTGIALGPSGEPWLSVPGKGLQRFEPANQGWSTMLLSALAHHVSCVVADDRWVASGASEFPKHFHRQSLHYNYSFYLGGVAIRQPHSGEWKSFSLAEGLPNDSVSALALDGNNLWVGGAGFIAVIDLEQHKMIRVCTYRGREVDTLRIHGGYVWAGIEKYLFRLPLLR